MAGVDMLKKRIIPCLDVRDGRVVKGVQFMGLRDAGDPVELSTRYADEGADELVMLDVSATIEGRVALLETIERIRNAIAIPLTVGGGVRNIEDARNLLNHGADKISVNSAAVDRPELIVEMSQTFGSQCTVVALDVKRLEQTSGWQIMTRSGTRSESLDAIAWGQQCQGLGAGEILLTSFDRDGTGNGYDCELIQAFTAAVSIPTIASGGARSTKDLVAAFSCGAHAVLAASIFHDQEISIQELKRQLAVEGIDVRL